MKAERRHELQTNSLAQWLWWKAPEIWAKHGSKILLAVVLVALGVVLIIRMKNKPLEERRRADAELARATGTLVELSQGRLLPGEAQEVETFVRNAREISDEPDILARASLLLGDYYWELASYPTPPEAATRPALGPSEPVDKLLENAERAYQQALNDRPAAADLVARAYLGLGTVAETRAYREDVARSYKTQSPHWAEARKHYQGAIDSPIVPDPLKDAAREKLANLERLQQPVWIMPATGPSTGPTTGPTTGRSIMDLIPGTRPVTGAGTVPATGATTRSAR